MLWVFFAVFGVFYVALVSLVCAVPLWLSVKLVCRFTFPYWRCVLLQALLNLIVIAAFLVLILFQSGVTPSTDLLTFAAMPQPLLILLFAFGVWVQLFLFATMIKHPESGAIGFAKGFPTFVVFLFATVGTGLLVELIFCGYCASCQ